MTRFPPALLTDLGAPILPPWTALAALDDGERYEVIVFKGGVVRCRGEDDPHVAPDAIEVGGRPGALDVTVGAWVAADLARAVAERERAAPDDVPIAGPIATWRAVAQACGVSEDTIARHRPPGPSPLPFASADSARAWFRRARGGRGPGGRPRKTVNR